jgi:glycosyltransferase involved in cell wall biosynthesis
VRQLYVSSDARIAPMAGNRPDRLWPARAAERAAAPPENTEIRSMTTQAAHAPARASTISPVMRAPSIARAGDRVRVVTLVDLLSSTAGAEHFALVIATNLDPARFDSTLCVSRWPSPRWFEQDTSSSDALARLSDAGVRFLPLRRTRKVQAAPWLRLARFLRRERVDVLHSHKFGSNVAGSIVARAAGVPVVLAHEHTWSYEGKPWRRVLDREVVSRAADRFIAVSRQDQRRMIDVEHVKPDRTMFVPIGIVPREARNGRDARAELGIPAHAPTIGVVGLMRRQKALDVLLRAAARVRSRWPELQVLLVGDGPERASLEALSSELGLESNAHFLGLRSDVPDILRALDIAVSSSSFEGSPAALLEAMEAGLPVVATSVGGIPDMIDSGVHGLLVEPGDAAALGDAIDALLRDPERAREMGRRGPARPRAEFDLGVMIGRFEALYVELLEQRGRRVAR